MAYTKTMKRQIIHTLLILPFLWCLVGSVVTPVASAFTGFPCGKGGAGVLLPDQTCCPRDQATPDGHSCCPKGANGSANSCLFAKYINPVITLLSVAVGVVAIIGIILGAIQYSASGGDPQQATTGKRHIRSALIGLLSYLLLYAFLQFLLPGGLLHG
jgi:hypothetical protein